MKLKEVLDKTTSFFKDKKIESARLDAELLLAYGLKLERIQLYLRFDQPVKEDELTVLRELVRRRAGGEPVAYILGYRDFYKYRFEVSLAVLIPRPETECLVEDAVNWAEGRKPEIGLVDLGCGTGCVGLSLLKELPKAHLVCVDISAEALEVAKRNAESLGVLDRARFVHVSASQVAQVLSAYQDFTGKKKIDILVSNPPYISKDDPEVEMSVKKFEPSIALFAEDDGLALLQDWSQAFSQYLETPGLMLMEMGMTQGPMMKEHFTNLKIFNNVKVLKDLAGRDRIIRGVIYG